MCESQLHIDVQTLYHTVHKYVLYLRTYLHTYIRVCLSGQYMHTVRTYVHSIQFVLNE